MQKILKIENLTFGYTKDKLLYKDFSLELKKGEVISIVGESGSGKSTLFELITGELKPLSGSIKKQSISQIFQDPYSSFAPSYTIIEQICDVIKLNEETLLNKSFGLLKKLNLSHDLLFKKPFELSGGQLQRCSILRLILMKPKLILADEPTSALDNITALDVMKLLINLIDNVAILLITHDLNLASWCSDKIVKIK